MLEGFTWLTANKNFNFQIQKHMSLLQEAYEGMVQKVENLKHEKILSQDRISRASLLTDALAGEKVWEIF